MTTKPYNPLLDDKALTLWRSPSGKRHVGGWFGMVLCGAFVDSHNGWRWSEEASIRYLALVARSPSTSWCKRCIGNYKDVILDA